MKKILLCIAVYPAAALAMFMTDTVSFARDPFVAPAPSPDMYDYQGATHEMQLRGLFITSGGSRAVLFNLNEEKIRIVSAGDEITIDLEGLKHRYKVASMGRRSVTLAGGDGKSYRIGVEELGNKK